MKMTVQGRIGIIVPSNNTVLEAEADRLLSGARVSIRTVQLPVEGIVREQLLRMSANTSAALHRLIKAGVDMVLYACLSTSLAKDLAWEAEFGELVDDASKLSTRHESRQPARPGAGAYVTSPPKYETAAHATIAALKYLGARRVSLVSPYPASLHRRLPYLFQHYGVQLAANATLNIGDLTEVGHVDPGELLMRAHQIVGATTDAICVVATDIPTLDIIEPLELSTGVPVVTTNQALIWAAVSTLGLRCRATGSGRLFSAGGS